MFLRIMKKGILLLSLLFLCLSCSEYQKLLKSDDTAAKYTKAEAYYNKGLEEDSNRDLRRALGLMEQIESQFRGKPQGQRIAFLLADTYYRLEDYYLSSFQFERFLQLYPDSEKAEEAAFKMAASFYYRSPRYNLDQSETNKAIEELQVYLNRYPEGEFVESANDMATELRIKLEKKSYEIAKQYHLTQFYKAAIASFNNFIADYPGSPFREAAYYYRFDSAYKLAINSYEVLMEERLEEAKEYYKSYKKYYPEGEYIQQIEESLTDIDSRLQNF
ncbi:outer membrane protein assembly factor BamD [Gramella sp. GC03-9]|uniref:Outer membrane protein assembly factor BamD n=1 Tax=Christiangramia oceanisediminis TaxID=2920386 RepID=A0A9X2IBC4_9FLAO|nr:outer membrane protein assembly factor BamD [Gramella oceanisediminis]MCP9199743.1 outer membrane protein assembly factor BamD [Gramella oceanisediminis]